MHFVLLNIGWENQTVVSKRFEPGKYYVYIQLPETLLTSSGNVTYDVAFVAR